MNSVTRMTTIALITDTQNDIIDYFNKVYKDLKVVQVNIYGNRNSEYIYYSKDNEWILYVDVINGDLWGNFDKFFIPFVDKFNIDQEELMNITKLLFENTKDEMYRSYLNVHFANGGLITSALLNKLNE